MEWIRGFFNKLLCFHEYKYQGSLLTCAGTEKINIFRCSKCGKVKNESV